jgi:hypothetical protein
VPLEAAIGPSQRRLGQLHSQMEAHNLTMKLYATKIKLRALLFHLGYPNTQDLQINPLGNGKGNQFSFGGVVDLGLLTQMLEDQGVW